MPKKILIVEDEKPLSHALDLKLQHEGFATTIAHNGEECLQHIENDTYDAILLDLMMPIVDGFKVLEELNKKTNKPVVFVLSNLSQREDESRALSLGAQKYFVKADTPLAVIVEEIKKALG